MTQAEFDALEKAAKISGAPIAEIIRRAVAAFLNLKPKGHQQS
jgi:hypothetical protein